MKHPKTKTYIVCAKRKDFNVHSPNFRNTLTMESRDAVHEAYRVFVDSGTDWGVRELFPLQESETSAFFFFRDPGTNCWELSWES